MTKCIDDVEMGMTSQFKQLAQTTLCSLFLFNRIQRGEAQRVTVKNFVDRMKATLICPEAEGCLNVPLLLRTSHIWRS